jgi:hypothetical protein
MVLILDEWHIGGIFDGLLGYFLRFGNFINSVLVIFSVGYLGYTQFVFQKMCFKTKNKVYIVSSIATLLVYFNIVLFILDKITGFPLSPFIEHPLMVNM